MPTEPTPSPLFRTTFDASSLIVEHPPKIRDRNKQALLAVARDSGSPFEGEMRVARWPALPWPQDIKPLRQLTVHPGYFTYAPAAVDGPVEWHVNFADPTLFTAYAGPLFAQDEMLVVEHPILGSVVEALKAKRILAVTVDDGKPTPITITGAQRRIEIETAKDAAAGRPNGLYGNAFSLAPVADVIAATRAIIPPTVTNLLAIAAPYGDSGAYTEQQISHIVGTAYSGFVAARIESGALREGSDGCVIHTGFWGCGAFGGNREMMTLLQLVAADLAQVDLVFHAVDPKQAKAVAKTRVRYERLREESPTVGEMLNRIEALRLLWGVSDGN